jgi:ferredoxin
MAWEVRFRSSDADARPRRVAVSPGTTLLDAARSAGLPVARGCGGGGLCGRCGLRILAGAERVAPEAAAETRAKERNRIDAELRLACQVRVAGPLEVTAAYW